MEKTEIISLTSPWLNASASCSQHCLMEVLETPPAFLFHTHSSEQQQSTAEFFLDELLNRKWRLHREIEVYAVYGWICFLLLTSALPEGSQQPALSSSVRWRSGVLTAGPQAPSPAKLSSRCHPTRPAPSSSGASPGARGRHPAYLPELGPGPDIQTGGSWKFRSQLGWRRAVPKTTLICHEGGDSSLTSLHKPSGATV